MADLRGQRCGRRGRDTGPWPAQEGLPGGAAAHDPHVTALLERIERLLLKAMLTPQQARSVDACGWFELPWPEQWLVLRIHTDRAPTVEAFQPRPRWAGAVGSGFPAPGEAPGEPAPGVPLRSWNLRGLAAQGAPGALGAPGEARLSHEAWTVRYARWVLEAHRRGALRRLLEAADAVMGGAGR